MLVVIFAFSAYEEDWPLRRGICWVNHHPQNWSQTLILEKGVDADIWIKCLVKVLAATTSGKSSHKRRVGKDSMLVVAAKN